MFTTHYKQIGKLLFVQYCTYLDSFFLDAKFFRILPIYWPHNRLAVDGTGQSDELNQWTQFLYKMGKCKLVLLKKNKIKFS